MELNVKIIFVLVSLRYPGFRKKCERSEPPGQVYSAEKAEKSIIRASAGAWLSEKQKELSTSNRRDFGDIL